jgi:aminoglycoside phosphotransferase (APT) family kinase protein
VQRLIAEQFPQWAGLAVEAVEVQGWDNRTFRLGAELSVRLPSHDSYVPQVEKEHAWLPKLAPHLPLPIPVPLARGLPSDTFPRPWSVYRWIEGDIARYRQISDPSRFAVDLAGFLSALYAVDSSGGPPPGMHSFNRGGPLANFDEETRAAIESLRGTIDTSAAREVWNAALEAPWRDDPVWVHGDVAVTNLLVRDGQLSAVIDFGCSAVGDPACDMVIAWTLFSGESRKVFIDAMPVDDTTWARGRGWALWKGVLTAMRNSGSHIAGPERRALDEVLTEHRAHAS